jgi:hypothetical protein
MEAHRRYYRFGLCPGFWDCLAWYHKQGNVSSIDRVRKEVDMAKDELQKWVKSDCPSTCFGSTADADTGSQYGEVMAWAAAQGRYLPEALSRFATAADGWLVAHAKQREVVVVTQEVAAPESKRDVKIPDVCNAFDVPCIGTFEMLMRLGVQFTWRP